MKVIANEEPEESIGVMAEPAETIQGIPSAPAGTRPASPKSGPSLEGQLQRGIDQLERGDTSAAIVHFRAALALEPASIPARVHLATAYAVDAQVHQAIELFEEALVPAPDDFLANLKLGELYLRLWVPEKARKHLGVAREVSRTPGEREMVRRLLAVEAGRERRRIDRPSFGSASTGYEPGVRRLWNQLRAWCRALGVR